MLMKIVAFTLLYHDVKTRYGPFFRAEAESGTFRDLVLLLFQKKFYEYAIPSSAKHRASFEFTVTAGYEISMTSDVN